MVHRTDHLRSATTTNQSKYMNTSDTFSCHMTTWKCKHFGAFRDYDHRCDQIAAIVSLVGGTFRVSSIRLQQHGITSFQRQRRTPSRFYLTKPHKSQNVIVTLLVVVDDKFDRRDGLFAICLDRFGVDWRRNAPSCGARASPRRPA